MLDILLDQEGLEVDPEDRLERDSPLHKAVRFVNGLPKEEWEAGASIVELLLDAGADPRYLSSTTPLSGRPFSFISRRRLMLMGFGAGYEIRRN